MPSWPGCTAIVLVAFNGSWLGPWESLTILAVMFTGTMIYRAEHGQSGRRRAAVIAVGVFALILAAGLRHSHAWHMAAAADFRWER